ncbi:MAG TPA: bifunctional hydroxymethylpyrimidine kinase/phosphomethylpyrimidine kinase [Bryobacteraceae bacterium]|nr:bifunctional hydroxymethylpyrimidine kinase/phosphomethylpyrimidine kinase [Bryobacteraceae bacterium]
MHAAKPVALTIAGSDPSGGAGIQADLKTFHQFGVYGEAVITLVTVQNTVAFGRVECLKADLVAEQIRAVVSDIPPHAAKTGALGNREIIEALADLAPGFQFPLIVDPVIASKHGGALLSGDAIAALKTRLLPHAFLLTPNIEEAELLTGREVRDVAGMKAAAEALRKLGLRAVLVKGGHMSGSAIDVLLHEGGFVEFPGQRIESRHTHGTGCTFSAAITALLASGHELVEAIRAAKQYVGEAIRANPGLGAGMGPLNHHAAVRVARASADPEE